jgi:hypothetical protein
MNQEERPKNTARGLCLLSQIEKFRYFKNYMDCDEYRVVHEKYPFSDIHPVKLKSCKILFVGAHSPDMTIEAFIVSLREYLGYTHECRPQMLRIIKTPCLFGKRGQENVFFEIRFETVVIISGETNNFAGAGNTARIELEDVFDALSKVYDIKIQYLELAKRDVIETLYHPEIFAR